LHSKQSLEKSKDKKQNESRQGESRTTNHWHSSCCNT